MLKHNLLFSSRSPRLSHRSGLIELVVERFEADAQLVGKLALAGVRIGLEKLENPIAVFVGQHE